MKHSYLPKTNPKGRWRAEHLCQPTEYLRNKYYAYLKHRAQARHRSEDYTLTWEDWHELWTEDSWQCRGRRVTDLCLGRLDWAEGWHKNNVRVMTRRQHFDIRQTYYDAR